VRLVFTGHIAGAGTGSGLRIVAEFVASTYRFDRVEVGEVSADLGAQVLTVATDSFDARVGIGGPAGIDLLLRLVPRRLACSPKWLRAIDPIAARVVPGVHTFGTAGNGRVEYYGVRRSRRISSIDGHYRGVPFGRLAPLRPPVSFGFSSAPSSPQMVSVTTTIEESAQAIR
jgi:hypothetical protein